MPSQSNKIALAAAYLVLCIVWSSTWLAIKVGLRDLPPISFVAIRFVIAIAVLVTVSIGRFRLLPLRRPDYLLLFTQASLHGSYVVHVLPTMVLMGTGIGVSFPSLMTLSMSGATPSDSDLRPGRYSGCRAERSWRASRSCKAARRGVKRERNIPTPNGWRLFMR